MSDKIFLVEDEPDVLTLLEFIISNKGFKVHGFINGKNALKAIEQEKPDLVLLDIMLPDISGLQICKTLRANTKTSDIPIIMLTSKSEECDILTGYDCGCDDYVTKPFSEKILLAKINRYLKKTMSKSSSIIRLKNLTLYKDKYEVSCEGRLLDLTPMEFKILLSLVSNKGKILSRDQIMNTINDEYNSNDRVIDVKVSRIRKILGKYSHYIKSIYGVGYSFREDAIV